MKQHFRPAPLHTILGEAFKETTLKSDNLSEVIAALVSAEADVAFERHTYLHQCLQEKCAAWEENASEDWIKEICRQLSTDTKGIWKQLSLWSVLHGYPKKVLEYVLPPQQVLFVHKIPPAAIQSLELEPTAREQISTQIGIFFTGIKSEITSSEEFLKVLNCTSGRLLEEYQQIFSLLDTTPFAITQADVSGVQEKFNSCPGVSPTQLKSLSYRVMPNRPTLLESGMQWNDGDWVRWAVDEYIPYRNWQTHSNHFDAQLEETVQRFSEWYVENYVTIHKQQDTSLIYSFNELAKNWGDSLDIILVIDCLPINFLGILEDSLKNVGFNRHNRGYRFSALPTVTEHNKYQLFRGEWGLGNKSYESLLKARAKEEWGDRNVIYLSNLKALSDMVIPTKPSTIVLNYIDGDELLHEDLEARNTTHEEELHRLYARMAEAVRGVADKWTGSSDDLHVHVVTDHGACRILEEEKSTFDSKVVSKLFPDEKYRFSSVDKGKSQDIPDNLWSLGFHFSPPFNQDDSVYFIPRGHNTVRLAGKNRGYTHGGATPEEVIVPIGFYKPVPVAWKNPLCRFLNLELEAESGFAKFFILRMDEIKIEIQNPNTTEIKVLRVNVLTPETDLKDYSTPIVPAGGEAVVVANCYFMKSALDQSRLEIEITYEIAGDSRTVLASVDSRFKSAMATGFSIKDL